MKKITLYKKFANTSIFFLLSVFLIACGIFSYQTPSVSALTCSCVPNLAVYPKGNDPHCIGGTYNVPTGSTCNAGGASTVGGSANTTSGGNVTTAGSTIVCNVSSAKTFKDLVMNVAIGCVIIPSFKILVGLALVVFLWGIFKYVRNDGEDKAAARKFILYGIIGLFVMLSVAGLVEILQTTFAPGGSNGYNITPRSINLNSLF